MVMYSLQLMTFLNTEQNLGHHQLCIYRTQAAADGRSKRGIKVGRSIILWEMLRPNLEQFGVELVLG